MSKFVKISFISGLILVILGILKFELPYSIRKTLPDFINYFVAIGIALIIISFLLYLINIFRNHSEKTLRFSKVIFYSGVILVTLKIILEIGHIKSYGNYAILFIPIIIAFPLLISGLFLLAVHYILLKNHRSLLILIIISLAIFLFVPIIKVSYNCVLSTEGYSITDEPISGTKYTQDYNVSTCSDKWKTPYMYINNLIRFGYQQ